MYLSWIIPSYKEEKKIEKSLLEVSAYLRSRNFPGGYEIIVVDSSSPDRTAAIVDDLKLQIPNVRLLVVENKGKGWAVKQGMLLAKGQIKLFSDADNATSPDHFDKMIDFFEKGCGVVISSRNPKDAPGAKEDRGEEFLRQLAGKAGNLLIQTLTVPGIWDTQNGFKAFGEKAAGDIFPRLTIYGFAFDIEVLVLAKKLGYDVKIIPVNWKHNPESSVTLFSYFEVLSDVFKIRWNLVMNKY